MPVAKYISVEGQNLFDVALAAYGKVESVIKLMSDNGITDIAYVVRSGEEFIIDPMTDLKASHMDKMGVKPVSKPTDLEGIDYWAIEDTFIIQ